MIIKINIFRGELSDISAKTATLFISVAVMLLVVQYREYFLRRKDKLRERRAYYEGERISSTIEYFDPGSAYGVKLLKLVWATDAGGNWDQQSRTCEYYSSARLDGMAHKDETIGVKTIELYEGREDRLCYQSVTYGKPKHAVDPAVRRTDCCKRESCIVSQQYCIHTDIGNSKNYLGISVNHCHYLRLAYLE